MARKDAPISVLQFGDHGIGWLRVNATPTGLALAENGQARPPWADGDAAEPVARALAAFAQAHDLRADRLFTIVPRHELTTRLIDLPSQDDDEIMSMLRLNAEEYVPFPVAELIIGFTIVRSLPGGESRVLAAFVHRDVIHTHMDRLHAAGLEPEKVLLSTECLVAAAQAVQQEAPGRYALVNLAAGGVEGIVFDDDGALAMVRGVATSHDWPDDGPEKMDAAQELELEVRGTLAVYRRESIDGIGVEDVWLASDIADPTPYIEGLEAETGKRFMPADWAARLLDQGGDRLTVPAAALLGGALIGAGRAQRNIDLLPASVSARRLAAVGRQRLLRVAAVLGVVAVALLGLHAQAVWQRENYIAELDARIAELAPQAEGVAGKRAQLNLIKRAIERHDSVIALLAALARAAPEEDVNITRLVYDANQGIDLYGRGMTRDHVMRFSDDLRGVAADRKSVV